MVKIVPNDTGETSAKGDAEAPRSYASTLKGDGAFTEPPALLTDEQLLAGGMERDLCWKKKDPRAITRQQRNDRYRSKQAETGVAQLSLRVPTALTAEFKSLARNALATGELLNDEARDRKEELSIASAQLFQALHEAAIARESYARDLDDLRRQIASEHDEKMLHVGKADSLAKQLEHAFEKSIELSKHVAELEAQVGSMRESAELGDAVNALPWWRLWLIRIAFAGA